MKKNIKYVCVLITLTLFMFVSCSGNLTDTLLKVMDSTNTNVFEQTGIVKPDTSAADNALKAMNSSKVEISIEDGTVDITSKEFAAIKEADIKIQLDDKLAAAVANGVLAPQTAQQKASFAAAINSTNEASQKAMAEKLTKTVSGEDESLVKGTMALASAAITSAASKLGESSDVYKPLYGLATQLGQTATDPNAVITEADKVQAQLLTNIAVSAAKASEALTKSDNPLETKEVKELVNDTLTLYKAAKIASGSVDILKTEGLFDVFTKNNSSSKDVKAEKENDYSVNIKADEKYVKLVINLIENGIGTDPNKYNSKYNSYKCMVDARNLTFAIVNQKVDDPTIKASATTGSVIELLNAALFANLLDPELKVPVDENERGETDDTTVPFRKVLIDIVESSPDLFSKGDVKSKSYSYSLNKLFGPDSTESDYDFKKLGIDILNKLLPTTASTADNMMKVGDFNIAELLKSLNISGDTGSTFETISDWLTYLIEQMGGPIPTNDQEVTK